MAKTKKELRELQEKMAAQAAEMHELTADELRQVTGGGIFSRLYGSKNTAAKAAGTNGSGEQT